MLESAEVCLFCRVCLHCISSRGLLYIGKEFDSHKSLLFMCIALVNRKLHMARCSSPDSVVFLFFVF